MNTHSFYQRVVASVLCSLLVGTTVESTDTWASGIGQPSATRAISSISFASQALSLHVTSNHWATLSLSGLLLAMGALPRFSVAQTPATPPPYVDQARSPKGPITRAEFYSLMHQWETDTQISQIERHAAEIDDRLRPLFNPSLEPELGKQGDDGSDAAWRVFRIRAFSGEIASDLPELWASMKQLQREKRDAEKKMRLWHYTLGQELWAVNVNAPEQFSKSELEQQDKRLQHLYDDWQSRLTRAVGLQVPDGGDWKLIFESHNVTDVIDEPTVGRKAAPPHHVVSNPVQWVFLKVASDHGHYWMLQRVITNHGGERRLGHLGKKMLGNFMFDGEERHFKDGKEIHPPELYPNYEGGLSLDVRELHGFLFKAPNFPFTHSSPLSCVPAVSEAPDGLSAQSLQQDIPSHPLPETNERETANFKTMSTLVQVPVVVTDPWGRFVYGLTKDQFQVYENGRLQTIEAFSEEEQPVSVTILLDISGSMGIKMAQVQNALEQFVGTSHPDDEFSLVLFNDHAHLVVPFTHDLEKITHGLESETPQGRTAINDAVSVGAQVMKSAAHPRKIFLIFSDGEDNASRIKRQAAVTIAREGDIQAFAIGLNSEGSDMSLLDELARDTGGHAYKVNEPSEIPGHVMKIANEIHLTYVIHYSPATPSEEGKWVPINVVVHPPAGFKNFKVTAKPGYRKGSVPMVYSMGWTLPAALSVAGHVFGLSGVPLLTIEGLTLLLLTQALWPSTIRQPIREGLSKILAIGGKVVKRLRPAAPPPSSDLRATLQSPFVTAA